MKKGEEKEFKITFPKNYQAQNLANQKVKFKVKLNLLNEVVLPEVNEDFVQKITGTKKSVDDFRKEIKNSLMQKEQKNEKHRRENEWIEQVSKKTKLEIPDVLITEEISFMIDDSKMQGLQQGIPWEKYLLQIQKTEDEIKKEMQAPAKKRIQSRLVVQEIIKKEQIVINDKEAATSSWMPSSAPD